MSQEVHELLPKNLLQTLSDSPVSAVKVGVQRTCEDQHCGLKCITQRHVLNCVRVFNICCLVFQPCFPFGDFVSFRSLYRTSKVSGTPMSWFMT